MTGEEMHDHLIYAQVVLGIMEARLGGGRGKLNRDVPDEDLAKMCAAAKDTLEGIYMQLGGVVPEDHPAPTLYYPPGGMIGVLSTDGT